jgi:hypothetical protein
VGVMGEVMGVREGIQVCTGRFVSSDNSVRNSALLRIAACNVQVGFDTIQACANSTLLDWILYNRKSCETPHFYKLINKTEARVSPSHVAESHLLPHYRCGIIFIRIGEISWGSFWCFMSAMMMWWVAEE